MAIPATCDLCDEAPPAMLVTLVADGTSLYACVPCLNALTLQLLEHALGEPAGSPSPSPPVGGTEDPGDAGADTPAEPGEPAPGTVSGAEPSAPVPEAAPARPKSDTTTDPPPTSERAGGKETPKAPTQHR